MCIFNFNKENSENRIQTMGYVFCLLSIFTASILVYIWKRFYTYSEGFLEMAERIPGPRKIPFIGNLYLFLGSSPDDMHSILFDISKAYQDVARLWLGPELFVIVKNPEDVKVILSSKTQIEKASFYKTLEAVFHSGLLLSQGEKWRKHRKLLNPMFNVSALQFYTEVFCTKVLDLCDALEAKVGNCNFDIVPYLEQSNFKILTRTALPEKLESELSKEFNSLMYRFKEVTFEVVERIYKPWLHWGFLNEILPRSKRFAFNTKYIRTFCEKTFMKTKSEMLLVATNGEMKNASENQTFTEYFLKKQMAPENQLTDEEVVNEMMTINGAAFETTTPSMSFIIYLISKHPDVQEKIVQEILDVFGTLEDDRPITYEDILKLEYLDRVIKEGLRLYTAPYIGRRLTEDIKLPSGYILPRDSNIIIFIYAMHRDPENFPNPDSFNPDNFLPERVAARHPLAFIPFSYGIRNCIGHRFAMINMKTHVVGLLRRFVLTPADFEPKPMTRIGLHSANGIRLGIQRRNDSQRFMDL